MLEVRISSQKLELMLLSDGCDPNIVVRNWSATGPKLMFNLAIKASSFQVAFQDGGARGKLVDSH